MGIGSARGADRAIKAAELAVASPLLEASIDGAHGVLLSIQGGSNLGIFEINDAARLVQEAVHPEANIIFGAVIDDTLGDEVRVTVIAAGFDGGEPGAKGVEVRRADLVAAGIAAGAGTTAVGSSANSAGTNGGTQSSTQYGDELTGSSVWSGGESAAGGALAADPAFEEEPDDLDIPDFLK